MNGVIHLQRVVQKLKVSVCRWHTLQNLTLTSISLAPKTSESGIQKLLLRMTYVAQYTSPEYLLTSKYSRMPHIPMHTSNLREVAVQSRHPEHIYVVN